MRCDYLGAVPHVKDEQTLQTRRQTQVRGLETEDRLNGVERAPFLVREHADRRHRLKVVSGCITRPFLPRCLALQASFQQKKNYYTS